MRFVHSRVVPDGDPWSNDWFDRRSQVAPFLACATEIEPPGVVTVEADYGCGKSFFIDRACIELAKTGQVVRINAWKDDVHDDPNAIIIGSLLDHLHHLGIEEPPKVVRDLLESISIMSFVRAGIDVASLLMPVPGVLKDVANAATSTAADKSRKIIRPRDLEAARVTVREKIGDLIATINPENPPKLYLVVDDLDRCRPEYVVRFLEAMRNTFDCPNVTFILAISASALADAVKSIFGIQSPDTFLRRFIDIRYPLAPPDMVRYSARAFAEAGLEKFYTNNWAFRSGINLALQLSSQNWLAHEGTGLRDIDKAIPVLGVALRGGANDRFICPTILTSLVFYKFFHEKEFRECETSGNIAFTRERPMSLVAPAHQRMVVRFCELIPEITANHFTTRLNKWQNSQDLTLNEQELALSATSWLNDYGPAFNQEASGRNAIIKYHYQACRRLLG